MNPATIAGIVVVLVGFLMAGDPKSFGFKGPAVGFAIAGAGLFLGLFGYFGSTDRGNSGGGAGRKVRDYSV